MKKIMKVFVLVAAAAMALASCQKPEVDNPNPQEYEYTFLLGSADTKAVIGKNSVEWENGDQIGIYAVTTSGVSANKYGAVTPGAPAKMVIYSENALTVGDMVYAYYPRIGTNADTPDAVKMSIPSAQDGKNDMPMVSLPLEMETEWKANDNETSASGLIKFCNVGSVIEFNVYYTESEYLSEKIQSVSFIADKSIAGDFEMNMEAVDGTDATLAVELTNGSKEVVFTLSTPAEVPAEKSSAAKINMVVAPGTYTGTVVVKTDKASYTFNVSKAKEFARSTVKPLAVDLAKGERVENVVEPEPVGVKTATISFASTAQRTSYSTTQQVWENQGVIFTNSKGSSTTNVGNYSNPARFYKSSNISVTAPGNITKLEFDCKGIGSDYVTPLSSLTGASKTGDIITISLDGTSSTIEYKGLSAQARANSLTVTYVIADPTAPSITAGNAADISARGVELAELTYEVDNIEYSDLTVTCDGNVVTAAARGEDGVINYAVSANQTASAREGLITISYGDLVEEVKVSQLAPVFTVSMNAVELGATKDSKTTVTVTSDFDWTLSSEGAGYTVTPNSYTWTTGGEETITIQATANRAEEGVADLGKITLTNSVTGQKLTIDVTQATSYVSQESIKVEMPIYANKGTKSGTSISWTKDGFTVKNTQANGSTAIRTSDSDHYRIYAKSQINFTSSNKKFNKVVVTCTGSSYATALKTSVENAGLTATVSGSEVTISISAPLLAMPTITASEQIRIKKVVVELN